jgi:hypothetical protein
VRSSEITVPDLGNTYMEVSSQLPVAAALGSGKEPPLLIGYGANMIRGIKKVM